MQTGRYYQVKKLFYGKTGFFSNIAFLFSRTICNVVDERADNKITEEEEATEDLVRRRKSSSKLANSSSRIPPGGHRREKEWERRKRQRRMERKAASLSSLAHQQQYRKHANSHYYYHSRGHCRAINSNRYVQVRFSEEDEEEVAAGEGS